MRVEEVQGQSRQGTLVEAGGWEEGLGMDAHPSAVPLCKDAESEAAGPVSKLRVGHHGAPLSPYSVHLSLSSCIPPARCPDIRTGKGIGKGSHLLVLGPTTPVRLADTWRGSKEAPGRAAAPHEMVGTETQAVQVEAQYQP